MLKLLFSVALAKHTASALCDVIKLTPLQPLAPSAPAIRSEALKIAGMKDLSVSASRLVDVDGKTCEGPEPPGHFSLPD